MIKTKFIPGDSVRRTQDKAIDHHNKKNEVMASCLDVVKAEGQDLAELKQIYKDSFFMTSTRIDFEGNLVWHYFGSNQSKPLVVRLNKIPVYNWTPLPEVLSTKEGILYASALFLGKKGNAQQITKLLEEHSGKKAEDIRLYTPDQEARNNKPFRSVDLFFNDLDRFNVDGDGRFVNVNGLSRGVVVESAEQTKFFSNHALFDIEEKKIIIPMPIKLHKEIGKKLRQKKKVKINWKLLIKVN